MKLLRLLAGFLVVTILSVPKIVVAQNSQVQKSDKVIKAVENKKNEELKNESDKIVQEAVDGVILTKKAYQLLDQDKADEAKAEIVKALSEIDAAISSNQGIALLPLEADVQVLMGIYDLSTAIEQRDVAQEALNLGDVQAARILLSPMVDEINVKVVSIPVVTYERKLNDALGQLKNGKKWEARRSLKEVLSLFILNTEVIPIPVIEAEALIDEAVDAEKTNKEKAVELLKQANDSLLLAETLGYTTEEDKGLWHKMKQENKKLSKFKHRQMKEKMVKKINNLESKIKDGTTDMHFKMTEQINKIKEKLVPKK